MKILGIETSAKAASVAVISDEKFLAEIICESSAGHSETLMPHIEKVLEISGAEKIDAVAVSIGPGSFTGLRIGLAAAKALAYAWKIKIVGVETLAAMSYHFPNSAVLPMIDAQKNRAYVQKFSNCTAQTEIEIKPIDEIINSAGIFEEEIFLCGDVLHKIKVPLPENVKLAPINLRMPRAVNVAMLGKNLIDAGKFDNVMNLEPLYIRRSEAEVLWEKRQKLLSEK